MTSLDLTLRQNGRAAPLRFEVRRVINAGFTGRDRAAVQRHIDEMRVHGIPCPDRVPVLYPKMAHLLTTAGTIEVLGSETSGEAEFVLLAAPGRILVACGSDHTDRGLEKITIEKSKLVAPNVISSEVWDLEDVRDGWDDLVLTGHATVDGRRAPYQEGRLGSMMRPDDLLALVRGRLDGDLTGTAIFSGTFALLGGAFAYGERFEVELRDDRRGTALRCDYRITPIRWLRGEG